MARLNLQAESELILKCVQLYETIKVRHGLMLVGLPFAGKTTCYRVLAAALGDLERANLMGEHAVKMHVVNPKSITIGQPARAALPVH